MKCAQEKLSERLWKAPHPARRIKSEASGGGISGAFGLGGGGCGVAGERRASRFGTQARPSRRNVYLHVPAAVSHRGENAARGGAEICRAGSKRSATACAPRDSWHAMRFGASGNQAYASQFAAGLR